MASNLDLLLEAERRGILPDDKKGLLEEARKRGLVDTGLQMPVGDGSVPVVPGQETPVSTPTALDSAKSAYQNFVGEKTGLDPQTYETVHNALGVLTPLVGGPAALMEMLGGGIDAAMAGGARGIANLTGTHQSDKQPERDAVLMGQMAQMLMGAENPAMLNRMPKPVKAPSQVQQSRADMVGAFDRSGVTPSVVGTSGSESTRALGTGLEKVPVVGEPIRQRLNKNLGEIEGQAQKITNQLGKPSDDYSTGAMLRNALGRFARDKEQGKGLSTDQIIARPARETSAATRGAALYDKAGIDKATQVNPVNTLESIGPVVTKYNDEALADVFKNTSIRKVAERLQNSEPVAFEDLKQLRRDVWKLQREDGLASSVDSSDISRLYGAITSDLEAVAKSNGKLREFRSAEKFWRSSQEKISEQLGRFAGEKVSNEQAFNRLVQATKEGGTGNIKSLAALRASLRNEEWGQVAATVFDRLGKTTGDETFNVNNFITNYTKLSPQSRRILTSHKPELRPALEDLTKVARQLQTVDRSRPRGSAPTQVVLGLGALAANIVQPITVALSAAGISTSALMSSPRFVRWLAKAGRIEKAASEGADVSQRVDALNRDLLTMRAANDIGDDVSGLARALGIDRAAAEEEDQNQPQ